MAVLRAAADGALAGDAIGADDVRALRARQRELGVREALEWVAETTPSLADAARRAGMEVAAVPLLAAPAAASPRRRRSRA